MPQACSSFCIPEHPELGACFYLHVVDVMWFERNTARLNFRGKQGKEWRGRWRVGQSGDSPGGGLEESAEQLTETQSTCTAKTSSALYDAPQKAQEVKETCCAVEVVMGQPPVPTTSPPAGLRLPPFCRPHRVFPSSHLDFARKNSYHAKQGFCDFCFHLGQIFK